MLAIPNEIDEETGKPERPELLIFEKSDEGDYELVSTDVLSIK